MFTQFMTKFGSNVFESKISQVYPKQNIAIDYSQKSVCTTQKTVNAHGFRAETNLSIS